MDQCRLNTGDIYPDLEMLTDDVYDYLLDKYENNVNRASLDAARYILFTLSRWTRERTGDIEVYGSEFATNYRKALLEFLRNPELTVSVAMPYFGGISKTDMLNNDLSTDNVRPSLASDIRPYTFEYPLDDFKA